MPRYLISIAISALSLGASAQNTPAGASTPGQAASPGEGGYVEFAQTPYRIESLGMSMWLPADTQIDSTNILGGDINFQITAPDNSWVMRGLSPESRDKSLTTQQVMESLRDGILKPDLVEKIRQEWKVQGPVGVNSRLIEETPDLTLDDKPASRFYASIMRHDDVEMVTGYTVQWLAPGRFMLYEFTSLISEFPTARLRYETILAATTFEDPGEAAQLRAAGVLNAHSLLTALTGSDIDELIGDDEDHTFYRLFRKPQKNAAMMDDEEIAYQRLRMWKGQRGEVNPNRQRRNWGVLEREQGWLVEVSGRFLDRNRVIETQGFFFLSRTQENEIWTITTQIRDEINRTQTWSETGVRDADDLKVTVSAPGQPDTIRQWKKPAEAYCPQVLTYILPKIYTSLGAPQVFNVYRYNSSTGELSMRSDSLEPAGTGAGWLMRTRQHENAREEISTLNENGRLTRRVLSDGILMEPIELETLFDLWKRKDLPLE
ncbi:MAG: hypothetical protein ACYTF7_03920 [Planctomycetota bacterium]|jgi:hypothetical protein